jgi:acyl-coenzyme A synthetase/AMP-(fatty) acid ligase/acyl carrier protein
MDYMNTYIKTLDSFYNFSATKLNNIMSFLAPFKDSLDVCCELNEECAHYKDLLEHCSILYDVVRMFVDTHQKVFINYFPRGFEMIIGQTFTFCSGAIYLAYHPDDPLERLNKILEELKRNGMEVGGILTVKKYEESFNTDYNVFCVDDIILDHYRHDRKINIDNFIKNNMMSDNEIAYIAVTSGTTGVPKLAKIKTESLINYLGVCKETYFKNYKKIMNVARCSFDSHIQETIVSLMNGMNVVMIEEDKNKDVEYLRYRIESDNVEIFSIVPSMIKVLKEYDSKSFDSVKVLILSGEALRIDSARWCMENFKNLNSLVNSYGPAECTVETTAFIIDDISILNELESDGEVYVPIGYPHQNYEVLLDRDGVLLVEGEGVMQGYVGKDDIETYDTGDVCRYIMSGRCKGSLTYICRRDRQIKINGQRVEVEEIINCIKKYGIKENVEVVYDGILECYIENEKVDIEGLRDYMIKNLPSYMVPKINLLKEFPLTVNGKVDVNKLKERKEDEIVYSGCGVFDKLQRILNRKLEYDMDLFEDGVNSLLLMEMVSKINKEFSTSITYVELYECLNVRELMKLIDNVCEEKIESNSKNIKSILMDNMEKKIKVKMIKNNQEVERVITPLKILTERLYYLKSDGSETSVYVKNVLEVI